MSPGRRPRSVSSRPATLADHHAAGAGIKPTCRACWREGQAWEPLAFAERYGLAMATPHPDVERRLLCSRCGARQGYLQLINPNVDKAWVARGA